MQINTVSVKQLRENFAEVKEGVESGLKYILIYRSQPLAEIRPIKQIKHPRLSKKERIKRNVEKVRKLAGGLDFGKDLTPAQINKIIQEQYDEEVKAMLP